MPTNRPRVFIASSAEGRRLAENLQAALEDTTQPTVWDQSVLELSEDTLGGLLRASETFDYAVLVLTPDDIVTSRDQTQPASRDNVIFEAGLFFGAFGRHSVFMVRPRAALKIPSDLLGVTTVTYDAHRDDGNLRAAVNPAAVRIKEQIVATLAAGTGPARPRSAWRAAGLVGVFPDLTDEDTRAVAHRIRNARAIFFCAHTGYNAMVSTFQAAVHDAVTSGATIRAVVSDPAGPVMQDDTLTRRLCPSVRQPGEIAEVVEAFGRHRSAAQSAGHEPTNVELRMYRGVPSMNLLKVDDWLRVVPYLPLVDASRSPVFEYSVDGFKDRSVVSAYLRSIDLLWADSDPVDLEPAQDVVEGP
jgi:hypothetical protein